jgi:hypothetical protein
MAGGLFCLEHFLIRADQRGTIAGLTLLVAEALIGGVAYLALLAVLAPHTVGELTRAC